MTQKSGLEMIEILLEKVEILDRRFTVVEQNVKELLSRANGFIPKEVPSQAITSVPKLTSTPGPSIVGATPSNTLTEAKASTKVMGKIKNKEGKSIIGADVTVVKENGEIIKQTKTNRAGEWMCFLPPGMYKAKYFLDNIVNANVNFNIIPEQTIVRVAQPKWG